MPTNAIERPRLWVVSELYYPEETSTGYYMTRIAEGLAGEMDVKAVSGQPTYSARGTVAPSREVRNCVEIFRVRGTRLDKNVIVFRLLNMLTLSLSVFFTAFRRFGAGDRVLVVTNPPTMPFIVALASLFKGAGYTLLIHDNYPEMLVATKKIGARSLPAKVMAFCNRWLYKHSERIIVVGRDMKELVARKAGGLAIPIITISNWAELESISPAPKEGNSLLAELGLSDKFVLLYAGNMGHPNDMESIVDCAEAMIADKEVHFVFLGTGVKRNWLLSEVNRRSLLNVTVLDPRPRSDQQIFLNACDVAIVSLVSKMKGVSMPSRTYNILAAGKPILALAEPNSEIARIIDEERVGWTVSPGSSDELVTTVRNIAHNWGVLAEMGVRSRLAAETKYSLETALQLYRQALNPKPNDQSPAPKLGTFIDE